MGYSVKKAYVASVDVCRKNGIQFDSTIFSKIKKSFTEQKKEMFNDLINHSNDLNVIDPPSNYKLYKNQINVLKYITTENYYLVLLHTAVGSGKTTLLPLVVNILKNKEQSIIIFACSISTVIYETAENCIGLDIKFAFAHMDEKGDIIYIPSDNHKETKELPSNITLIICDPFVAYHLLFRIDKLLLNHKIEYCFLMKPLT